ALGNGSGGGGGGSSSSSSNGCGAARSAFGDARSVPGVVPPVAVTNGRGQPSLVQPATSHNALYSRSRAPLPRPLGREYDASRGVDDEEDGEGEDGTGSDAGSDGSYSAPKSHSLNFILH
ncbi:hypothetical protein PybrP1_011017, partial [[Pythium] brassicae (nom. inval.)]